MACKYYVLGLRWKYIKTYLFPSLSIPSLTALCEVMKSEHDSTEIPPPSMSRSASKSIQRVNTFRFQPTEDSDSGDEVSRAQSNRKSSYTTKSCVFLRYSSTTSYRFIYISSGACVHCKSLKVCITAITLFYSSHSLGQM